MTERALNKAIAEELKKIRQLLIENGGCQYLSMSIHEDGVIIFNNAHWDEKRSKGLYLDEYIRGNE